MSGRAVCPGRSTHQAHLFLRLGRQLLLLLLVTQQRGASGRVNGRQQQAAIPQDTNGRTLHAVLCSVQCASWQSREQYRVLRHAAHSDSSFSDDGFGHAGLLHLSIRRCCKRLFMASIRAALDPSRPSSNSVCLSPSYFIASPTGVFRDLNHWEIET